MKVQPLLDRFGDWSRSLASGLSEEDGELVRSHEHTVVHWAPCVRRPAGALAPSHPQAPEAWPEAEAQTHQHAPPERYWHVTLLTPPSLFRVMSTGPARHVAARSPSLMRRM